ncbi:erythromycin biosynthesis sensory transduction protein eryC1 [Endozoicomonas montiporae]|uniref:Erythromycin biosynthesis sensory transduction protein eryC1 n=2 Tax=Endozoicomonas montiporae TaxID=1027273 RepID=A0A081N1V4_9GAMM|nr:DegT/DnrJ/EryC1/StrS family aminotransferase [Endozoicomonas montiporae]AMO58631.1 glutamine-scyllo-inositol transaminase -like protein [Endozoicomonas montiporae CL-33]KEQ12427.1 erythromycin biosynthesis sensory transduction protein eryC1 [Endozoicomonas montiporae]
MISMVDPTVWHASIQNELEQAALEVLRSGRFIMGSNVAAFEQEVAEYLGSRYAISCANGTDALVLALTAAGIVAGDEVITTPFSFFATAEAIVQVGACPVFVDINPESFNLDVDLLEQALSDKTKAVLPVHLFGLPVEVKKIQAFCHQHGLWLLEDCAQSFGASVEGQHTGTYGHFGCFSFFPSKNLGGFGDGGLVITQDKALAEQLIQLRNHGSQQPYLHHQIGYNSRLDELQAALLRVKLRHIDEYNRQRQQVAEWYWQAFCRSDIQLPEGEGHVFHQYTVLLEHRDLVRQALEQNHIASAIYYQMPLHRQPALMDVAKFSQLPVAEKISRHCLSLPVFPGMSQNQVNTVAEQVLLFGSGH